MTKSSKIKVFIKGALCFLVVLISVHAKAQVDIDMLMPLLRGNEEIGFNSEKINDSTRVIDIFYPFPKRETLKRFKNLYGLVLYGSFSSMGKDSNSKNLNEILTEVAGFQTLRFVIIIDKDLSIIPPALFSMKQLEGISLAGCNISYLSDSISNLVNLRYLTLGKTLYGEFVYPYLKYENHLKTLPESINKLRKLKYLNLACNDIRSLPRLKGLINLEYIDLSFNGMKVLPQSIGDLKNLKFIQLDSNQLSSMNGVCLKKVNELILSYNNFSEFPPEIESMRDLEILDFGYQNNNIPPEITHIKKLKRIYLKVDTLDTAPMFLAKLHHLTLLDITAHKIINVDEISFKKAIPKTRITLYEY